MAGRRLVLNGALKRTGNGSTAPVDAGLPRYAFIAHPACCEKCNMMDSRLTGRLYSVGDTWRISHINCLCSTVEVPASVGMGAAAVQAFAANPVGGVLRRGFNYGQSFAPQRITAGNVSSLLTKAENNAALDARGRRGRFARKNVIAQQKGAYRRQYNNGKENWNNVLLEQPEETKMKKTASRVKVARTKAEKPVFTPTGRISVSADITKKKKKAGAARVASRRAASIGTRDMAKLFGAVIK